MISYDDADDASINKEMMLTEKHQQNQSTFLVSQENSISETDLP
jgi:hypothetical protein